MAPILQFNLRTGHPSQILDSLSRTIGQLKRHHSSIKIGITGRHPSERFSEHLQNNPWDRMIVIYQSSSERYVNDIENYLIDRHQMDLDNKKPGGGSWVALGGKKYVYVLLRN